MTAYGEALSSTPLGALRVQIRSLNRKGFELQVELPAGWGPLEPVLRQWVGARFQRGTVSVAVEWQGAPLPLEKLLHADPRLLERLAVFKSLLQRASQHTSIPENELLLALGPLLAERAELFSALEPSSGPPSGILEELQPLVELALEQLDAFRLHEGRELLQLFLQRLEKVQELREQIEQRVEGLASRRVERLKERLHQLDLLHENDRSRWLLEAALLVDRFDVQEELDRLRVHQHHFRDLLENRSQGVGRRLDFLIQEMLREINTLMSKSQEAEVSFLGIELRATLEKVREQLQNVE